MKEYIKDFTGWANVARVLERRGRAAWVDEGMVCWASLGVNIGSEEDGKDVMFTRPVLILKKFNTRIVLCVALTSRKQTGPHYLPVVVNGKKSYVILDQIRTIDTKRIGSFISGISGEQFALVKKSIKKFLQ